MLVKLKKIINFYPFERVVLSNSDHKNVIENIDIGGPTMVRSAAKNYNDVVVLSNSKQYEDLAIELNKNRGSTNIDFREKLAEEAFMETAYYAVSYTHLTLPTIGCV